MSKAQAQNVILGEDRQHSDFLRHYLIGVGYNSRQIRVSFAPSGSGEQFVRERYPVELRAHRSRAAYQTLNLLAMTDEDTHPSGTRASQLQASLQSAGIAGVAHGEHVAIFVPKRNIETWIMFLGGAPVDEATDYKPPSSRLPTKPAAQKLLEIRSSGWAVPPGCPHSLVVAFTEFQRLRG